MTKITLPYIGVDESILNCPSVLWVIGLGDALPVFEKMRLSLAREDAGDLLEMTGHREDVRSKPQFIKDAFSNELVFLFGRDKNRIIFSPLEMPDGYAGGFFKRERPITLQKDDLTPYKAENFEGLLAVVALDKKQHIWVEKNKNVAEPKPLLEAFFKHIVKKTDVNDYNAQLLYVDEKWEYWRVIKERKREITSIAFTFIPPNPLGHDDEIYELVTKISEQGHPDTQEHIYKSRPGKMDPESPYLAASARVAMAGGGEAEVKSGKRVLYSSKSDKARTIEEVPEEDMPTPDHPSFIKRVIARLFS